jgi:ribulose-5-phosphate 4-epimerase/fuculose-1-phosphate aldolase
MGGASISINTEAEARMHLAALYRLIDFHYGVTDGIYNHISLRVPDRPTQFLIKPHIQLYREVTASSLVMVDMDADLDERAGVNRPGFVLHSSVLRARPKVNCAVHLHTNAGIAMSAHKRGLRMLSQNALRFYNRIGYQPYAGIVEGPQAGLQEALGANNIAVILRNHGLVTVGATPRDAFECTRDLVIACETQLLLEASGSEAIEVSPEICAVTAEQYERHDSGRGKDDWPAWLRLLDATDPSYRN